jgi:hypothetical protein
LASPAPRGEQQRVQADGERRRSDHDTGHPIPPERDRERAHENQQAGGVKHVGDPAANLSPFAPDPLADASVEGRGWLCAAEAGRQRLVDCRFLGEYCGAVRARGQVCVQAGILGWTRDAVDAASHQRLDIGTARHRTAPARGASVISVKRLRARCRWLRTVLIGMSSIAATCSYDENGAEMLLRTHLASDLVLGQLQRFREDVNSPGRRR